MGLFADFAGKTFKLGIVINAIWEFSSNLQKTNIIVMKDAAIIEVVELNFLPLFRNSLKTFETLKKSFNAIN